MASYVTAWPASSSRDDGELLGASEKRAFGVESRCNLQVASCDARENHSHDKTAARVCLVALCCALLCCWWCSAQTRPSSTCCCHPPHPPSHPRGLHSAPRALLAARSLVVSQDRLASAPYGSQRARHTQSRALADDRPAPVDRPAHVARERMKTKLPRE